jgi:antitoxin component YwqK of YwqJK toxin-antitoxin module
MTLLLSVAGCKKKEVVQPEPEPVPVHPDLICPDDTDGTGAPPPAGQEVWCQQIQPNGRSIRHGPAIEWHSNEERRATGEYYQGDRHGPWLFWFPTGSPERQGSYTRGVKNGIWTEFHVSGDRKAEGEFVEGSEHGPWVFWEDDTRTEGTYVMGAPDGVWLEYTPENLALRERVYRGGRLVSQREL